MNLVKSYFERERTMLPEKELSKTSCAKFGRFAKNNVLLFCTLIGATIGIAAGLGLRNLHLSDAALKLMDYPGEICTRALQLMILPLVVCNLVVGSSSLNARTNSKIVGKALLWFLTTTIFNAFLGVALTVLVHPGLPSEPPLLDDGNDNNSTVENVDVEEPKLALLDSFLDLGRNIVPSNLFSALFQQTRTVYGANWENTHKQALKYRDAPDTIGVITFALIFGMILGTLSDERAKKLIDVFHAMNQVIMVMIKGIMWLTPFGVGSLVSSKLLTTQDIGSVTAQLGLFTLTILGGIVIYQLVILQLAYVIIIRKNPIKFYKGLLQAALTAFATSSTIATLPLMLTCMDKLKINTRLSHFLLPIAVSVSKDGGALFIGAAPVFIAQMSGIDLDYGQLVTIVIAASAATVASAGVPSGAIPLLFVILNAVGVPTKEIGLLFAVDWLIDRIRTPNNVFGNCYAVAFIEHWSANELKHLDGQQQETNKSDNDEEDQDATKSIFIARSETAGTNNLQQIV